MRIAWGAAGIAALVAGLGAGAALAAGRVPPEPATVPDEVAVLSVPELVHSPLAVARTGDQHELRFKLSGIAPSVIRTASGLLHFGEETYPLDASVVGMMTAAVTVPTGPSVSYWAEVSVGGEVLRYPAKGTVETEIPADVVEVDLTGALGPRSEAQRAARGAQDVVASWEWGSGDSRAGREIVGPDKLGPGAFAVTGGSLFVADGANDRVVVASPGERDRRLPVDLGVVVDIVALHDAVFVLEEAPSRAITKVPMDGSRPTRIELDPDAIVGRLSTDGEAIYYMDHHRGGFVSFAECTGAVGKSSGAPGSVETAEPNAGSKVSVSVTDGRTLVSFDGEDPAHGDVVFALPAGAGKVELARSDGVDPVLVQSVQPSGDELEWVYANGPVVRRLFADGSTALAKRFVFDEGTLYMAVADESGYSITEVV